MARRRGRGEDAPSETYDEPAEEVIPGGGRKAMHRTGVPGRGERRR